MNYISNICVIGFGLLITIPVHCVVVSATFNTELVHAEGGATSAVRVIQSWR